SSLIVTYPRSNPAVATIANNQDHLVGAGTTNTSASQADNENFLAAVDVSQGLTVNKAAQKLTFDPLANKLFGEAAFNLAATSNGTESPITFVSSDPSIVSVSNSPGIWKAPILKPGAVTISASQAATANYLAAENVQRTFQVLTPERLQLVSTTPSENVGQDYTPWLTDNMSDNVVGTYGSGDPNNKYIEVTIKLATKSKLTKVSLYDGQGSFANVPVTIYALNGTQKTQIGVFDGASYMSFVNYTLANPLEADAIVIHKHGNAIPLKVQAFGFPLNPVNLNASTINFLALPDKKLGDPSYILTATSTNAETPVTFVSLDPSIASVSFSGGVWRAHINKPGSATIKAMQAGTSNYGVATTIFRTQAVSAPERLVLTTAIPNENVGQNYDAWLTDDMNQLVQETSGNNDPNSKYIDVTITLDKKSKLTKVSLYDGAGSFSDFPATIYALNGLQRTKIGNFNGGSYNTFVDLNLQNSLEAEAIVIRKYRNAIPLKVRAYGFPAKKLETITFAAIGEKKILDPSFNLLATSTNTETPVTFSSSDASIISISNSTGAWKATILKGGTVTISASQASTDSSATTSVQQIILVKGAERLPVVSAIPSENVGQDYYPWLTDDLAHKVTHTGWGNQLNNKYIDVTLKLAKKSILTKVSLYDGQGDFDSFPVTVFALNGTQKTLIGTFRGLAYMSFVDYTLTNPLQADAIIIHKYGNSFPEKVFAFGYLIDTTLIKPSVINFSLTDKYIGDQEFVLNASSTNFETPITYSSSDSSVVSLSYINAIWKGKILKEGTVNITASQQGNLNYKPANVVRTMVVKPLERIYIAAIVPDEYTGQNYSPWLSDSLDSLVQPVWGANSPNNKYIDVTLWLQKKAKLSYLSFYDHNSQFFDTPASIYALNGTQKTLLGAFTGAEYMSFVNLSVDTSIVAEAIVIRKFGNAIPQKINIYGRPLAITDSSIIRVASAINFAPLSARSTADATFNLVATSNNTESPIIFVSTNPEVVSVSNSAGIWKATILKQGTANIIASQEGSDHFFPAASIVRSQAITQASVPTGPVTSGSPKIELDLKQWYALSNSTNITPLFDGLATPSLWLGNGRLVKNPEHYYPLKAGEELVIDEIRLYDGNGSDITNPTTISVITDTWQRIQIAKFTGSQYMAWVGPYPDRVAVYKLDSAIRNARYIVITEGILPTEISFYGSYKKVPNSSLFVKKPVKLKEMFGVNAFEWDFQNANTIAIEEDKIKMIKSFTGVRHYMDWSKLEATKGSYTFNPTRLGGWNFDSMYERCKSEGIEVLACLKTIPSWMEVTYPEGMRDIENVPSVYGKDLLDPVSYIEQAKVGFQYAARYGFNRNVNPSLLSVNSTPRWNFDPTNTVKIGMGLIKFIECDNERDKSWKGRQAYQTGREYAANLSAFYDGHKNTMGPGIGIKNADPSMKVVIAGLVSPVTDYTRGMVDWCKEFRGYNPDSTVNLCWDIVNYHAYSNDAQSSQDGNNTRGAAPEKGGLAQVADMYLQFAHESSNDQEVWVTETGFDSHPGSSLRAIPIADKTVEQVRGDWILRTSLLYARQGIKRCFFYSLYDLGTDGTHFSTSGLVNSNKTRRVATDYLYQTNKLFGEFTYKETLNSDPFVDRYQFNGRSMYSLVVPDEVDRKVNYTLSLGAVDSAYIYYPKGGQDSMHREKVKTTNGLLYLQVTETPMFVQGIEALQENNNFTWTGSTSTELDSIKNWKNTVTGLSGSLPGKESVLIIPGGLARYPKMTFELKAKDVIVKSGAILNLNGNNLDVTGNIMNSGQISWDNNELSSITFSRLDSVQRFTGNRGIGSSQTGRLIVNNSQGLVLDSGAVDVYDLVTLIKGSITSKGNLTLKVGETRFASIGSIPAGSSVAGVVNVEAYLTGGSAAMRSNRMISSPVNDLLITGQKSLAQIKNYVVVTGLGGQVNGFDPGGANTPEEPTFTRYNEASMNWQPQFTNVNNINEAVIPGTGLFMFYRGNRTDYTTETASTSPKVNTPYAVPENTILTYTGPINQGNISVPLQYTYNDGEGPENGHNVVGNPYPCAISWNKVDKTYLEEYFKILKPDGSYASYSRGIVSNAGQMDLTVIQPGQAFYVKSNTTSVDAKINFTEDCKVTSKTYMGRLMNAKEQKDVIATNFAGKFSNPERTAASLIRMKISNDLNSEEAVISFMDGNSLTYKSSDGDAAYLPGTTVSLSTLTSDNKAMAINFLPAIADVSEIRLKVDAAKTGAVNIRFDHLPENSAFVLKDKYLNVEKPILVGAEYKFQIDKSKPGTFGSDRFVLSKKAFNDQPQINRFDAQDGLIFPNPAENILNVSLTNSYTSVKVFIYHLSGILVKKEVKYASSFELNVSELPANMYVIKLVDASSGKLILDSKFIKK
ncbi:MAG TPA: T9SS type A sorting domain-containing protein, partial [Pedobacter sp.]